MMINKSLFSKIVYACLIGIAALTLPVIMMEQTDIMVDKPLYRHLIQSCFTGLIAILGIWFLRSKIDNHTPISIGLVKTKKAVAQFLFGFGLIAVPLIITIALSETFGWSEMSWNINNGILSGIIIGLISTFFTDAITEELIFRGYIFSNLKERFNTWTSSLITLVLFVALPVIIVSIQKLFGIDWSVPVTGGYIITLFIFGSFVQYLRVLTKSIWAGVGFHLFFVQMNQLIGITDENLIEFSETSSELPIQITLISLLLLVFIGLIAYPIIKKRKNRRN
jgi:membrane protease YdiL (CAAX protease family)